MIDTMKASKATSVDQFIAEAPAEARPLVEALRKIILTAVPNAEETMSYGKPYYKYYGYMTGITLYSKHLGVEMWDGLSAADIKELEGLGYKCGSKNFNIAYDQSIPTNTLTRLVQAQAARNKAKG